MVANLWEYTTKTTELYTLKVNFILGELYLNKAAMKNK